jgi:ABC-type glycerol-3-phosphate transport system substrate-binding protein
MRYDTSDRALSRRAFLGRAGRVSASLAVAGGAIDVLAACGSSGSKGGGGSSSTKVNMWSQTYGDPKEFTAFVAKTAKAWNADEGHDLKWDIVPWTTALQKWQLSMSNGSVPDVGDMFFLQSRIVQGRGKWGPLDITDEIEKGTFGDWKRYVPVAQREASYKDRIYGIPWRIDVRGLVYNDQLMPKAAATLEELESMAAEAVGQHKLKAGGMTMGGSSAPYQAMKTIGAMWGVEFLSEDLTKSLLQDERWTEAALWAQKAVKNKILLGSAVTSLKGDPSEPMLNKSVAFQLGGNEVILPSASASAPQLVDHLKSAPTPVGAAGKSIGTASTAQFSVFQNSKSRDASLEWLKRLTEPAFAVELAKVAGQESADTVVQAKQMTEFRRPFLEASRTALGIDQPTPAWAQLVAAPEGPLSKLSLDIFGGGDPRSALKEAHEATQAILDKQT